MSALVDEGIQFDKSQHSSVGRSSCLVYVQWMKDQSKSKAVNPCLFIDFESVKMKRTYKSEENAHSQNCQGLKADRIGSSSSL